MENPTNAMIPPLAVETAYDLAAPFYDNWSWQSFWRANEYPIIRPILEKLRRSFGNRLNLLDVGCGTGWYLQQLRDLCSEQAGVDLSGGMLAIARHRLLGGLLKQADARMLPFADRRFDTVLCTRVLSHLPRARTAIGEMHRILTTGGTLILSDVDAEHDYQYTRLPVASGHVLANTYKHDRIELFKEVERFGFVANSAFLIHLDGQVDELRKRVFSRPAVPASGWISVWRKSLAPAPK